MIKNKVPWPHGARCAACVTFDMDAESLVFLNHPRDAVNRVSARSMLRYGPEIGIPRILDTYKRLNIRQTFFIPGWCIEAYPGVAGKIADAGHEVAHHGFLHEHPTELSRKEERSLIRRSCGIIENATGQRPRGSRAPLYNFSANSGQLLIEEGFIYDASLMGDDIPYILNTGDGELIELPSHWGLDDWPQFVHAIDLDYMMPVKAPSAGIAVFREELEAAWEYGGLWIPVCHPFATGRLSRWREMEKLLEYIAGKGDVWFAPMEEIACHVQKCMADGSYSPRVDKLPYYSDKVPL